MLKTTEKQQTLKAAVLSAVMVMSAIGMNVADAAVNTPGTGDDKGIAYGVGANAKGIQAIALGVNAQSTTIIQLLSVKMPMQGTKREMVLVNLPSLLVVKQKR